MDPALNPPIPKRTLRIAVSSIFFLAGLCFSSWASRIASIQQELGLSEAALGGVLFALPVGLMLSLPFSGYMISQTGSRRILIIGIILYAVGLLSLGLAQNTWQLIFFLFIFGFVSNIVNISVNTQAVGVEGLYHKPIMASFHGLWSLAGFTGAAIGTFMIGNQVDPYKHFVLILGIVVLVMIISSRYLQNDAPVDTNTPAFSMPDKSLINLGIIAFCSMICEGAMFDWSVVYFKKVVLAENAWLGAGYTAFMGTMATGRFVADWFAGRFGIKRTLQISGTLTATGLMIAVIFPGLVTAIAGFLLVGAGVSSVVPLVYSAAGRSKTLSPGVALAAVSTIGFLGFLIGPPVIGLVAGATNLRVSFSLIAVMGICVAVVSSRTKTL